MVQTINQRTASWKEVGIPLHVHDDISRAVCNAVFMSRSKTVPSNLKYVDREEGVRSEAKKLQEVCKTYDVKEHLAKKVQDKPTYRFEEGFDVILNEYAKSKRVIGITGCPATGKSTVLNHLTDMHVECFDEFWEEGAYMREGRSSYELDLQAVYDRKAAEQSSIVAAAFLDPREIDLHVHFQSSLQTRKANLERRVHGSNDRNDRVRLQFFDAYAWIDFFQYDLQKVDADIIIDTTEVSY